ncbi:aminoglycoside phosphotransferase family protein [Streptomyces sp. NPDC001941]|uniref:aminoglycoside phosphotransferase family protein n=1 Tax=Streptomyces sp. NPDC001941 TaxID=3154659 RepID=UPI003327B2E6
MSAPTLPSLPTLEDLLGPDVPRVLADCLPHTGTPHTIERITGGNVAHVFAVRGPARRVIIKIRREHFARIPALRSDPALITRERHLLQHYHAAAPGILPRVLAFHPAAHTLVLSDVFPHQRTYHQHLQTHNATPAQMTRLGRALRRIHRAGHNIPLPQPQPDPRFPLYQHDFALRSLSHPTVDAALAQMATRPGHQLIHGDLAPKNISITPARIGLCDLDNAHHGWPLYDIGYFTAHLLIHHLSQPAQLRALLTALLLAYQAGKPLTRADAELTATVAAAVVLYRLGTSTTPYPLDQPAPLTDHYRDQTHTLLDHGPVTFKDLLHAARTGTVHP